MEFGPMRSPVGDAQDASRARSSSDEDANSMADLDHAEIRQRRQRFAQDGQTDS